MENKKTELTDELDQIVGGIGTNPEVDPEPTAANPFKDLPRIDTNPYNDDIKNRI